MWRPASTGTGTHGKPPTQAEACATRGTPYPLFFVSVDSKGLKRWGRVSAESTGFKVATVDVKAVADTFLVSVDVRGLRPTACVGDWKEHGLSGRSG